MVGLPALCCTRLTWGWPSLALPPPPFCGPVWAPVCCVLQAFYRENILAISGWPPLLAKMFSLYSPALLLWPALAGWAGLPGMCPACPACAMSWPWLSLPGLPPAPPCPAWPAAGPAGLAPCPPLA